MTVHILVPGSMTVQQGHDLVDRIEQEICQAVGDITVVSHLEPLEDPASFNHEHPAPPEPPEDHAAGANSNESRGKGER